MVSLTLNTKNKTIEIADGDSQIKIKLKELKLLQEMINNVNKLLNENYGKKRIIRKHSR